jgi:hypothetical protein
VSSVNGEQVKTAVMAAGIVLIEHHSCAICNYMTRYIHVNGDLFFDAGCYCGRTMSDLEPRSWDEAARWINMQSNEAVRVNIARKFGIDLTVVSGEVEA